MTIKSFVVGLIKLVVGVSLALVLLSLAGVATARYFMAQLAVLPAKPVFDNEPAPSSTTETAADPEPTSPEVPASPTTASPPDAVVDPEPPAGSYEAQVVQPIGLVLRAGPGTDYDKLGGVDYNDRVLVLKPSEDGRWLNVKVLDSGQEGWVKAGNTHPAAPPP